MARHALDIAAHRQLAALAYRDAPGGLEILVITSRDSGRWVLPKGWPMAGRSDAEAAAQEAYEEAGVRGRAGPTPIGGYSYFKRLSASFRLVDVTVYPLEAASEAADWPERSQRILNWAPVETAADLVDEPGLKALLRTLSERPDRLRRAA